MDKKDKKKWDAYLALIKRFYSKEKPTSNVAVDGLIITPEFVIFSNRLGDGEFVINDKKPSEVDMSVHALDLSLYTEQEHFVDSTTCNKLIEMFKNIGKYTFAYDRGKIVIETGISFLEDEYELNLQGQCKFLGDLKFSAYSNWVRDSLELCNHYGTSGVNVETGVNKQGTGYIKISSVGSSEYVILAERTYRN